MIVCWTRSIIWCWMNLRRAAEAGTHLCCPILWLLALEGSPEFCSLILDRIPLTFHPSCSAIPICFCLYAIYCRAGRSNAIQLPLEASTGSSEHCQLGSALYTHPSEYILPRAGGFSRT